MIPLLLSYIKNLYDIIEGFAPEEVKHKIQENKEILKKDIEDWKKHIENINNGNKS